MSDEKKLRRSDDNLQCKAEFQKDIKDKSDRQIISDQHSKDELLHELQVHQIELEMQNQQLLESQLELEEARDRYADLYDYSPVGYVTLDESGNVLEINLTGAGMVGKERLGIVGQPFINLLVTSGIQPFLSYLRQVYSIPGNCVLEVQLKVKDQKPRVVTLESHAVEGKNKTCRMIVTDVSEQRQMASAIQVGRAAQDALLSNIPALVFYLNIEFNFLGTSQAFADFLGRPSRDIYGKTFYDLFPREIAKDFHQTCASVLQTGMALYGFENSVPDENGTMVCLSTMLAPFVDSLGKVIGIVGVSIDVSSIKSASIVNSELLIQNRKLTRSLFTAIENERRNLARELHDELGQWFTAIQAEAHVIANALDHEQELIHEGAQAIMRSTGSVHEIIRGMLRHLRPVLLDELGLADSLHELRRQWCHGHPDIVCELNIDSSLDGLSEELNVTVYRLVQEALNNIAKHAQAHRVVVSILKEMDKNRGADILQLKVEDDGSGFKSNQNHAGIGLLGMRERVIAAGGDFYIDATAGMGSSILARLPVSKRREKRKQ